MVDDFIKDTSIASLKRYSEQRWPVLTAALSENFELNSLGVGPIPYRILPADIARGHDCLPRQADIARSDFQTLGSLIGRFRYIISRAER
jgi:hypothetical protein